MRFSWLRSCLGLRKLSRGERQFLKRERSYVLLRLERLEDRLAPNVSWTGSAGTLNWTDKDNWSSHAVPGASDDVMISISVSGPIIITGTQSIHSLMDTTASLVLSSGSLGAIVVSGLSCTMISKE